MPSNNIEKPHIVAISNPRSGRNKRGGFEKFKKILADFPSINHIVTNSESNLISALNECKQNACEILIVNGGDGTLQHILTYLKQAENQTFKPRLVLLQAGTTSMAYGDVGCKGKLNSVLNKIIDYAAGSTGELTQTERTVLRMTLPETSLTVCGMFFGGGAIYNGILYCRQNLHTKGMRGELGPSMAMIRYLLDWLTVNKMTTSTHACINAESMGTIEGEFTIITATTLKRLLMGVYPFWGKSVSNSNFALSLIKRNAPKASKASIKILSGKPPDVESVEDYYRSIYSSRAILDINDGFTLDGELFGKPGHLTQVVLESAGEVTFLTT